MTINSHKRLDAEPDSTKLQDVSLLDLDTAEDVFPLVAAVLDLAGD